MTTDVSIPADPYAALGDLYLALVPDDTGRYLGDPEIQRWVTQKCLSDAVILDAGCGLGNDIATLNQINHRWTLYGSDVSQTMVEKSVARNCNLPPCHFRVAGHADLVHEMEWQEKFDVVIASFGIYTFPAAVPYIIFNDYFVASLWGLRNTLKYGGYLLFNNRRWDQFVSGPTTQIHSVVHNKTTYNSRYEWQFDNRCKIKGHGHHRARITLDNGQINLSTVIDFAGRTDDDLRPLISRGYLSFVDKMAWIDNAGVGWDTYVLRKHYLRAGGLYGALER